ncbi:NUDIX hydrolase domain-like protein [Chaetomidium leptoderma]|uniref:NUDIX hydrolase domain-like protein n=1 Tax=Chaetomidium leptoderma TaxID=669021 RepID=A0AAN6VTA3_9PEZI|nr:NUDIX hydrolase domain-like protein [Chaetomidium leptoderma]
MEAGRGPVLAVGAPQPAARFLKSSKMSTSVAADEQLLVHVGSPEHREEAQTLIQGFQDSPASDTALRLPADSEEDAESSAVEEGKDEGSHYWDAPSMAPLNAASAAAIARLKAYTPPPFPLWDRLPLSRRAAVLMLLYADRRGDLRAVITMRAASLRSFSGHAALPGGKADTLDETAYQIARREAWEEIGLPLDDTKLPAPFRIEHLCYLPMNLARTELVVRPCVALLHTGDTTTTATNNAESPSTPTADESLIPRLDAKEVAAVFSAPFHNFLKTTDELPPSPSSPSTAKLPPGNWYEGTWTTWHDSQWRMHFFYVPVTNQKVIKPKVREGGLAALSEHEHEEGGGENGAAEEGEGEGGGGRYKVWGMTGRILVDAATIAYDEKPEFEHNAHFGDEKIIEALAQMGRMGEKKRQGSVLAAEDLQKARDAVREAEAKKGGEASKM